MVTRKEKRQQEKDKNYFFELIKIQKHFFKELKNMMKNVKDPRHQSYITYDTSTILMMVILKNACNLKSMGSMTAQFNKDECIENIMKVLGIENLEELPHYDTINDFLSRLNVEELEEIRTYMIKELLNKRCFDDYRINGTHWGVIVDGTGIFTFDERHCKHCLKREYKHKDEETGEEKTKIIYMHHVLEAILANKNSLIFLFNDIISNR